MEAIRDLSVLLAKAMSVRYRFSRPPAALVLAANLETAHFFAGSQVPLLLSVQTGTLSSDRVDAASVSTANGRDNPLRLLWAGRMVPSKLATVAIEAIALLRARGINVRMTVVGRGPDEKRLHALVQQNKLEDVVSFSGWVSTQEVRQLLDTVDAALFCSARDTDSALAMEACARGKPTIAIAAQGAASHYPAAALVKIPHLTRDDFICATADAIETVCDESVRRVLAVGALSYAASQDYEKKALQVLKSLTWPKSLQGIAEDYDQAEA